MDNDEGKPTKFQTAFPLPNMYLGKGLTKREIFAMAAMQGLLASETTIMGPERTPLTLAASAVEVADQVLDELEK